MEIKVIIPSYRRAGNVKTLSFNIIVMQKYKHTHIINHTYILLIYSSI